MNTAFFIYNKRHTCINCLSSLLLHLHGATVLVTVSWYKKLICHRGTTCKVSKWSKQRIAFSINLALHHYGKLTCNMGSHSVSCHLAEARIPLLPPAEAGTRWWYARMVHWVSYCTINFTGSTSPTGCFSSWQWQFIVHVRFWDNNDILIENGSLNPPLVYLAPLLGVTPLEFWLCLWRQKTRVPGLSYGVVCVILHLAVVIQYRLVIGGRTHDESIYRWIESIYRWIVTNVSEKTWITTSSSAVVPRMKIHTESAFSSWWSRKVTESAITSATFCPEHL